MGFFDAPQSSFYANPNALDRSSYGNAIMQSQQNAFGAGDQQAQLAQMLMAQANGQGPSLAQGMLQQATDRNISQGAGAIASQRGLNPALQARMILQNQAAQQQQMAGQAGQLRLQEQMGAREQLGNVLNQQRSGDLGMFGTAGNLQNAQNQGQLGVMGLNQQTAAQNAQNQLGWQQGLMQTGTQAVGGLLGGGGAAIGKVAMGAAHGAMIPGHPLAQGDSPRNDTVPAMLSPGEIVLPRSVAQAPDADAKAAEFVAAIKKKKEEDDGEPQGYAKLLKTLNALNEHVIKLGGGAAK